MGKWNFPLSLSLPLPLPHFLRNASQLRWEGIFSRVSHQIFDVERGEKEDGRKKEKRKKERGGGSIGGTQEAAFSQVARRNIRYG